MPNDYFRFKKFTIFQGRCAMKVTTLACIQGAWLPECRPEHVLDIGAGTGLLSFMAAQTYDAQIHAVEIDAMTFNQLQENIDSCPWRNRITAYHADVSDFLSECQLQFDLIISNPPFYKDQLASPDSRINLARHHTGLYLAALIEIINTCMTHNGKASLLLPPQETAILETHIQAYPLFISNQLIIHHQDDRPAKAIVSILSRSVGRSKTDKLVIKNKTGEYTNKFKSLLRDYYLSL